MKKNEIKKQFNPSLDKNFQEGFFTTIKTVIEDSKTGKKTKGYALAELRIFKGKLFLEIIHEDRCNYFDLHYPLTEKERQTLIDESQGYMFDDETEQKLYLISWDTLFMRP